MIFRQSTAYRGRGDGSSLVVCAHAEGGKRSSCALLLPHAEGEKESMSAIGGGLLLAAVCWWVLVAGARKGKDGGSWVLSWRREKRVR